MLISNIVIVV